LRYDELLIKFVGELVKECAGNFIDKKAIINAERELINKEKLLKGVEIDDEGYFNFQALEKNLKKIKTDRADVVESVLRKIITVIFDTAKRILGEIQAKRLFEASYVNLQKKYGANLLEVLKVIPKGILETKKFELLEKEQLQKTAEELTKVETMKGEFMNIAAHELKTPLVPIISYLEMVLNDKGLTKDQRRKLKICLSSAEREVSLVNDILDISKLESGSLKLEIDEVDISKLLKEITDGMRPATEEKKIYLKAKVPTKLPIVEGDWKRLMQVVSNLINNATKFTDKGGITVAAEERDDNILVSVSDTGMGLSQENVKRLFTKFFQADTTARRKTRGTGLGLAICKGIVEGHKGKIWVKSELNKGTTFFFTVPIKSKEAGSKKEEKKNEEPEKKVKHNKKEVKKKHKMPVKNNQKSHKKNRIKNKHPKKIHKASKKKGKKK